MLNGLDLFSGIGGITLALRPWVRPVCYVEIEPYCQAILTERMLDGRLPLAPIWNDVTTLRGGDVVEPVDIIYGGFPCQDISVAGNGAGLAGERSGLFHEILRLAEEIQPSFIFLENVPAIRTRGLDVVVRELANLGYDCRWGSLSAFDVGAPHKRERWFLLAHSTSSRCGQESERAWRDRERGEAQGLTSGPNFGGSLGNTDGEGLALGEGVTSNTRKEFPSTFGTGRGAVESDVGGTLDGLQPWLDASWEDGVSRVLSSEPGRVQRIHALGNSVVPAQVREVFLRLYRGDAPGYRR